MKMFGPNYTVDMLYVSGNEALNSSGISLLTNAFWSYTWTASQNNRSVFGPLHDCATSKKCLRVRVRFRPGG